MINRRLILLAASLALIACSAPSPQDEATYYLIRHAEKDVSATANTSDPVLTEAGRARANRYVDYFKDVRLSKIYSSDYTRTRDTAAPVARAQGVAVTLYDAGDLPALARQLKAERGPILIVGHSNTTPQLAELLSGVSTPDIDEAVEHDRLYQIALTRTGLDFKWGNIDGMTAPKPGP